MFERCGAANHCFLKSGGWTPKNFSSSSCTLCSQVLRDLPLPAKKGDGDQYWGPTNVMLSLIGYAEAERTSNPQASENATQVVLNHFLAMKKMMVRFPSR